MQMMIAQALVGVLQAAEKHLLGQRLMPFTEPLNQIKYF